MSCAPVRCLLKVEAEGRLPVLPVLENVILCYVILHDVKLDHVTVLYYMIVHLSFRKDHLVSETLGDGF